MATPLSAESAKARFLELATEFVRLAAHAHALRALRTGEAVAAPAEEAKSGAISSSSEAAELAAEEARLAREIAAATDQAAAEAELAELGRAENARLAGRLSELLREEPTRDALTETTTGATDSTDHGAVWRAEMALRARRVLEEMLGIHVVDCKDEDDGRHVVLRVAGRTVTFMQSAEAASLSNVQVDPPLSAEDAAALDAITTPAQLAALLHTLTTHPL